MQITLDLVGKCAPYGKPCVHYDGEYRSDSPCGGCERNPKVAQLRDAYKSQKKLAKEIEDAPLPAVEGAEPDQLSKTEAANRQELADWGVTPRPSASKSPKKGKKSR